MDMALNKDTDTDKVILYFYGNISGDIYICLCRQIDRQVDRQMDGLKKYMYKN